MSVDEPARPPGPSGISCAARLELHALPGLPIVRPGDDLPSLIRAGLARAGLALADGDVLAVNSKIVSRSEGRLVALADVAASPRAEDLSRVVGHDPRFVELILRESSAVSRAARGVLVVRHRLGFVCANAGIDRSNVAPGEAASGERVLLLPLDPDASARAIRSALEGASGARLGVVITDSFGRPFRHGTVGAAIGVAGLPPLWDRRGERDLFGRTLEQTVTALADQVAAAADLVAGQSDEARPVVLCRGLRFPDATLGAAALSRAPAEDLYA